MHRTSQAVSPRVFSTLLALVLAVFPALSLSADNCCGDRRAAADQPAQRTCCDRHASHEGSGDEKQPSDSHHDCGAGCLSICCRAVVVVVAPPAPLLNRDLPAVSPTIHPEPFPHTPEPSDGIFHPPRG